MPQVDQGAAASSGFLVWTSGSGCRLRTLNAAGQPAAFSFPTAFSFAIDPLFKHIGMRVSHPLAIWALAKWHSFQQSGASFPVAM